MTDTRKEIENAGSINIEEIIKLLPHRYPFILVDRILEIMPGESIVGLKNVTINEPFFQGHFPSQPIMPGVLILEGMAQVGGLLAYITGIDNVRFRQKVVPGDQIVFKLKVLKCKGKIWKMAATAFVDEILVAEAQLMAALT